MGGGLLICSGSGVNSEGVCVLSTALRSTGKIDGPIMGDFNP